jgi:hypothetical protein
MPRFQGAIFDADGVLASSRHEMPGASHHAS